MRVPRVKHKIIVIWMVDKETLLTALKLKNVVKFHDTAASCVSRDSSAPLFNGRPTLQLTWTVHKQPQFKMYLK